MAADDAGAVETINTGHCKAEGSKTDTTLAPEMRRSKSGNSDVNIRINLTYDTAQLRDDKKQPEEQASAAILSAQMVELTRKLEQAQTENKQLLSQLHEKEQEIARLRNARPVAAAGTQTENDVRTAVETDREEVSEVKCQLTTLQQRCDQLVLETESLRAKLRYATSHHGITNLSYTAPFKPTNYSYKYQKC